MADVRFTRERSAWVLARAGRRPAARRRGERLAARARRMARYEAGAGDSAMAEVTTRSRFGRIAAERDDHRGRWAIGAALVEAGRLAVAGPAIGLSWAIYGAWYRNSPAWGPLRWRTLAGAAGLATGATVLIGSGLLLAGGGVSWWAWWLLAQPAIGIGRAAWLAYAYGWEAASASASSRAAGPVPITVRLGNSAPLPTTAPVSPTPAPYIPPVQVRMPAPTPIAKEN